MLTGMQPCSCPRPLWVTVRSRVASLRHVCAFGDQYYRCLDTLHILTTWMVTGQCWDRCRVGSAESDFNASAVQGIHPRLQQPPAKAHLQRAPPGPAGCRQVVRLQRSTQGMFFPCVSLFKGMHMCKFWPPMPAAVDSIAVLYPAGLVCEAGN